MNATQTTRGIRTAGEMILATGSRAILRIETMGVEVRILDARSRWGALDYQVTPVAGGGEQWVSAGRLTEIRVIG